MHGFLHNLPRSGRFVTLLYLLAPPISNLCTSAWIKKEPLSAFRRAHCLTEGRCVIWLLTTWRQTVVQLKPPLCALFLADTCRCGQTKLGQRPRGSRVLHPVPSLHPSVHPPAWSILFIDFSLSFIFQNVLSSHFRSYNKYLLISPLFYCQILPIPAPSEIQKQNKQKRNPPTSIQINFLNKNLLSNN